MTDASATAAAGRSVVGVVTEQSDREHRVALVPVAVTTRLPYEPVRDGHGVFSGDAKQGLGAIRSAVGALVASSRSGGNRRRSTVPSARRQSCSLELHHSPPGR